MSDRVLSKYISRNDVSDDEAAMDDSDIADDLGAFGWLRGVRDRAIMLELRKKTGKVIAVGYGWIEKVEFEPSEGITLHALGQKIYIKGRNLNANTHAVRLFDGIVRHRVPWIQEANQAASLHATGNAVLVETIEC